MGYVYWIYNTIFCTLFLPSSIELRLSKDRSRVGRMVKHNDWIYKKSHRSFSFFILYQLTQHSINYSFKIHGIHFFHVFGVFGASTLSLSLYLCTVTPLCISIAIFNCLHFYLALFLSFTQYLLLPLALPRPNKFQAYSNWIIYTYIKKLTKVSMSLSIKKFN